MTLGQKLKELRVQKELTQEKVARIVMVNPKQIGAYERDMRMPTYDVLILLAKAFNTSTDYLLGLQKGPTVSITGLTQLEKELVTDLVTDMSEKNKKLDRNS